MNHNASGLVAAGMSDTEAEGKGRLFETCFAALPAGSRSEMGGFFVPGRIEFLGKHTDYAGGRSLVCAVERGICVVARRRADGRVRVIDTGSADAVEFELSPGLQPAPKHWANYPMTVALRVAQNFPGAHVGADIAIASDLPRAAGMSSSSAVVVGVFLALAEVNGLEERPEYKANIRSREDLGGYLGTVENGQTFGTLFGDRGVGTFGGSQDHTAILCSSPGKLEQYSFCPVRHERTVPLPEGYVFAVGVSGVVAEKAGGAMEKYNRASTLVRDVLRIWNESTGRRDPTLAAAATSTPDAPERIRAALRSHVSATALLDRFDQFCEEALSIIPAAGEALAAGDLGRLGQFVDRSQYLTERKLANQVPETVYLARSARELGAAAASAFGAGFGGSVWALVRESEAEEFLRRWQQRYQEKFPERSPTFLVTRAGPAALRLPLA